jgi:predicted GIY-YIG superfamily endonuclease/pimeloyl-ACP methyl ester carboxylesterase
MVRSPAAQGVSNHEGFWPSIACANDELMAMEGATIYIVLCADGSYYTGLTRQAVETRVSEHNNGKFRGFTSTRRPVHLVYSAIFDRLDEAISAERRIKGWSRAKKEALIRGDFDALPGLAARRNKPIHATTVSSSFETPPAAAPQDEETLGENRTQRPLSPNGFLDIGDISLEYSVHGPQPSDTPTFVLLHEGLGCVGLWGDFPEKLAKASGAAVFCYSREGYGRSSPVELPRPLDYMQRHAKAVLPRILDCVDAKDIILVGHSDGASIAAVYAGVFDDPRLRGVVLIAPHFFVEDIATRESAKAKMAYETSDLRAKLARWHYHVEVAFRGWNDAWLDPNFKREFDIRDCLSGIKIPVLAIQGVDDQYGTLAQVDALDQRVIVRASAEISRASDDISCASERVSRVIHASTSASCRVIERVILPAIKHAPHREATDATIATIIGFARRLFPNPPGTNMHYFA